MVCPLLRYVNEYAYTGEDPVNGIDPLGLRDVDVYIWNRNLPSVGHVMLTEHDSQTVILSQFPHGPGGTSSPRGPNTKLDFQETLGEENREWSEQFTVHISNDKAFDWAVKAEQDKKYWDWDPTKDDETQCSRAGYNALLAGGVPLSDNNAGTLMPNTMGQMLQKLSKDPNSGVQSQQNSSQTTDESQKQTSGGLLWDFLKKE